MIIAFTGHRNPKVGGYNIPNPIYNHITSEIRKKLIELKPDKIISGMALGVDQWAAEIAIELGVPFIAAVPFTGQEGKWPQQSQEHFHELLSYAAEVVIVSPGGYAGWKMQVRNEWMIDHADEIIAVWDGSSGGTSNCVASAKSKDKTIHYIVPNKISI